MTKQPSSLQNLMLQAQAGEQRAYERLLREIQPLILRFLSRRVHNEQACLDVSQDVLMRVHAFRQTYDGKQKFEPWLFTIVRNAMIDYFRAHGRRSEFIESRGELPIDAGEEGAAEAKIALEQALDQLTPAQRETIEHLKLEGKSLAEIAKATGISLAAAKVRAHRAYEAFFQALGRSKRRRKAQPAIKPSKPDASTNKKAS